jgi:hypothetical protein
MLEGTLDDFDLRFVFRFLSLARKSGKLTVVGPVGSGRVFFRAGEIYHAESDGRRQGFGRRLINARKLTEAELRRTLEYCAAHGKGLGEGLVDTGLVARSDLERVLREEIEEVALKLFRNRSGRFWFAVDELVDSDTRILVRVESLLQEDAAVLKTRTPVLDPAFVRAAGSEPPAQISISPEEWGVIASIDGRRTVGDIIDRLGQGDFPVMRSLRRLAAAGLVRVPGLEEESSPPGRDALPPRPPRRVPPPPPPPPPPVVDLTEGEPVWARERG